VIALFVRWRGLFPDKENLTFTALRWWLASAFLEYAIAGLGMIANLLTLNKGYALIGRFRHFRMRVIDLTVAVWDWGETMVYKFAVR